MDPGPHDEGTAAGFRADLISMEQMRQKLVEVRDHFQAKVDRLGGLESSLQATFFGGHAGETGAFQASYQAFGREWVKDFHRMLALDQLFVGLIDEHGEAVKQAIKLYADSDESARSQLHDILGKMG
ncbi:hypothetical protein [Amycolatopsis plumensis]|uniref:Excreted virulence factor EspC, type VII ESX diderm n=1 Tax=Amycolatopsis plumensis TaxID=236508 RepID=A0ABV5TZZ6_9PSEU